MKNFHVRRRAHWVVMSLFLAVTGCGGDSGTNGGNGGGGGGGGGGTSVTVGNNFFNLPNIFVDPGATVTWMWTGGGDQHNVTFASSRIADSPTQTTGTHAVTMPATPAVYSYRCTIHGAATMSGSVTVGSGGGEDPVY